MDISLTAPGSAELDHLIVHIKKLNAHGEGSLEHDRVIADLQESCMSCDDRIIFINCVREDEFCSGKLIHQRDFQCVGLVYRLDICRRQSRKFGFSRPYGE